MDELRSITAENDYKTQKFLELVKAIAINKNHANENENRDLLKSVTSNLEIDGKKLVFTLQKPFAAIADWEELRYGEPYRATSRTFKNVSRVETKKIFKLIHGKEPPENSSDQKSA